jgi:hypothetical protein
MDGANFAFVPKRDKWVVHSVQDTVDTPRFCHNRALHDPVLFPPELLYARFAWALFLLVADSGFRKMSNIVERHEVVPDSRRRRTTAWSFWKDTRNV